jgi:hypothetical protein
VASLLMPDTSIGFGRSIFKSPAQICHSLNSLNST